MPCRLDTGWTLEKQDSTDGGTGRRSPGRSISRRFGGSQLGLFLASSFRKRLIFETYLVRVSFFGGCELISIWDLNAVRRFLTCLWASLSANGLSSSRTSLTWNSQGGLGPADARRLPQTPHSARPGWPTVRCWALPVSFTITRGITVVFFSSAYKYA